MKAIDFINKLYENTSYGRYDWEFHESLGTISTEFRSSLDTDIVYKITLYPLDNDIVVEMENNTRIITGNDEIKEFTDVKNKIFDYVLNQKFNHDHEEFNTDEKFLDELSIFM